MSRVGKKPIPIPSGVEAAIDGQLVRVKGPKGELTHEVNPLVSVSLEDGEEGKELAVSVSDETEKESRSQWGTARAIISNLVQGVTEGFEKKLEVNGVGYRVRLEGKKLVLGVGFSHDVEFPLPEGIEANVEGNLITISGIDRQLVGQTAAEIRKVRKPEPYKGKGIKYIDEIIRRKAGKAAGSTE